MSGTRNQMIHAIKEIVVPRLRRHDFAGSFPHFRRIGRERTDLMTFQFDRDGGGFIIEIGQCAPEVFTTPWGKQIPASKITAWDLKIGERSRIQPRDGSGTDSWFRFEDATTESDFIRKAEEVLPWIEKMEEMFNHFEQVRKLGCKSGDRTKS